MPLDDTVASIRRFAAPINVLPVPRVASGTMPVDAFAQVFGRRAAG